MEYPVENIKIIKLVKNEGVFTTEDGKDLPYSTYNVEFQIGEYPLIFRAKLDKTLKDYVEKAYEN